MRLIALLHGYGANGTDLLSLAPHWQRDTDDVFIAPNAPDRTGGFGPGYEWFSLDGWMPGTPFTDHLPRIEAAEQQLKIKLKKELKDHGLSWKDLVLMGFSQGAIMALSVGLSEPEACAGIMAYSGAYLTPKPPLSKPDILLVHGNADMVVNPNSFYEAKMDLENYDMPLTAKMIDGCGHWIDPAGLKAGKAFLSR